MAMKAMAMKGAMVHPRWSVILESAVELDAGVDLADSDPQKRGERDCEVDP